MLQRLMLLAALSFAGGSAFAQAAADGAYTEGKDYFPITPAQPTTSPGKIEVIEVFGYPCIHCAHAAPVIAKWEKTLPADVRFVLMPAVFGGVWEAYGRVYFAAETMGVVPKTHAALFEAIHTQKRAMNNFDDIAAFYAEHGVDKAQFLATLQSFPVNAKIADSQRQVTAYGVQGTPTMIVNGKYRVVAPTGNESFEKMLQVVDFLVAKERAATPKG
jgi:protein dithiol oxidoreductase (disulfide-forming)